MGRKEDTLDSVVSFLEIGLITLVLSSAALVGILLACVS